MRRSAFHGLAIPNPQPNPQFGLAAAAGAGAPFPRGALGIEIKNLGLLSNSPTPDDYKVEDPARKITSLIAN
jgi:hypothetical protein